MSVGVKLGSTTPRSVPFTFKANTTLQDGADATEGTIADAPVLDNSGTVNAHIRGLITQLANFTFDSHSNLLVTFAAPNGAIRGTVVALNAATPTLLPSGLAALPNRVQMIVLNLDAAIQDWIGDNAAAINNGLPLEAGGERPLNIGTDVQLYAIAESGTPNVFCLEIAA